MPVPNDNNLYGLNVGEGIGMGLLNKSNIYGDKYYDANSNKTYSIDSKGNLWGGITNIERPEEEEYDEVEQSAMDSYSKNFNGFNWKNEGTGQMVGGIASAAGTIGNAFLQKTFSNNQNTALSGAFSFNNEKLDEINGVNRSLNATDFRNLQGAYNNQNSILNGYKTKSLSKGQIGGMAGVGAAKGAAAGSAFGPWGCVCAGTRVIKNNGEFVNIEDLKQEDGIIGFGDNTIQKQTIFAFKPIAIKDCLRITFDNSDILECSIDHPIYSTSKGRANRVYINNIRTRIKQFEFKPACELSIGDKVAAPDKIDIWGYEEIQNARLIGLLIGDGSYDVKHGVRMYSPDKEIWEYIELNNLGYKLNDKYDYNVEFRAYKINNGLNLLRELGIYGQTNSNKTLVKDLYKYNKKSICELIGGLFDTDGSVYYSENNPKECKISFSQSKYYLIKQLKEILLKLGIHSYIRRNKPKKHYHNGKEINSGENFVLNIKDAQSIFNFYENISLIVKRKQDKLKLIYDFKKTITERNPRNNGIKSIKITNIEYIGKKEIYNLQADNYHTYIANGIITHNTAIGAVVGAGAGLGKGLLANKKIKEANEAASFAQQGLNNSYLYTAQNIRNINADNKKADMYNNNNYAAGGNLYADGGLINSYGINYFGNGKTHEQNKYGGIPVSVAEDGKPNLIEENEVLYDDYVYSNRIRISDQIRRKLKLKDSTKTFADAAKEIKDRGDERPNDPVTEHTIKSHMQILKSEQEKKKQQQEAKEKQKTMAQMQEQQLQAIQEQQMNQQANAYEQQMAQEQMTNQAPQEQMAMQEQQPATPYAQGGKLKGGRNDIDAHRFNGDTDWDSFEINGNRYNFKNKGDRSKGMWDYGYDDDGSDDEFYNYYSKIFKEGDDGYFTDDYTDYYNNAIEWARNLPEEEKEKFLEKYEPYYEQEFNGKKLNGSTDEKFEKFLGWASDNKWGNNHMILSDMYDHFNPQDEYEEDSIKEKPQQIKGKSNWMEYAPLGIDAYLAARSFAPVDYSRANAIMNTPIRDIQYTPNGGKIAPYIIDPRLQQIANYSNAQATNRAIQNNSGGNGANAVAAMLANNYAANQNAANIGFQADAQNAAQIQAAQQFNNSIDANNAQGFLQAASANQQADQVRGNFRADGLEMKDMLDSARGQAISNSMGALASDVNNLNTYLYNKNWNAALAGSGYYGNLTPEGMRLAGITYQNTPQAQLDREAQVRIAQMQSDDNQRAIASQEAIANAQLEDAARQRAWEDEYINSFNQ